MMLLPFNTLVGSLICLSGVAAQSLPTPTTTPTLCPVEDQSYCSNMSMILSLKKGGGGAGGAGGGRGRGGARPGAGGHGGSSHSGGTQADQVGMTAMGVVIGALILQL